LHEAALSVPRRNAASKARAPEHEAKAPTGGRGDSTTPAEREQSPDQIHHFAVVPVAALDRSSMRALAYAASLGTPVLALHISPNEAEAKRFEQYWNAWGDHLRLEVVVSPYRAIVVPLARYIEALHASVPTSPWTVRAARADSAPPVAARAACRHRLPPASGAPQRTADRGRDGSFHLPG